MSRARMRSLCATIVACLFVAGFITLAEAVRVSRIAGPVAIKATPITSFDNRDPSQTRFGTLEFRGGLVLNSKDEAFGGISAIHMEPDGAHFLAATDQGSWLRGRIEYRDGRPAAIADAEMAPILGSDGKPLASHGWYDVESLTERDGIVFIGIERVEQIVRFDYRRDGLLARGRAINVPAEFKTFTYNKSLECLTAPLEGALAGGLIAITEHSLDNAGNLRSFVLGGEHATRFSAKRSDDYDVSDCTILSGNDLLLLERRYSPARGVAMRIRRIPLADVKADAIIDGPAMIEADLGYQIDNMEGIAVHRNAAGETIITLVSDDNFSVIQRSLLLQFALVGD
ncbi:MAG TPA: esterase-like activity of phytase family protein [Pseudolabrys sp.]|nr:esterase-like activity of phytase family protein [Pseudolabrys sp.]